VSGPSSNPKGSFKIGSDRTQVKSFTLRLVSSEGDAYGACNTWGNACCTSASPKAGPVAVTDEFRRSPGSMGMR
jgi:hypothetical protein